MKASNRGLIAIESDFGPEETIVRLEREIQAQGMRIFVRINHAALATEVGLTLRPTVVIIFGNPRGGTPLMQANQTIGIDLPLKALVWQDASGKTWVSYSKPGWLVERHGIEGAEHAVTMMDLTLSSIAAKAISLRAAKSFESLEGKNT